MQSEYRDYQLMEALAFEKSVSQTTHQPGDRSIAADAEAIEYRSHFTDCMEMSADAQTVAAYLDTHQDWFRRCAHPMRVDLLSANAYALTIGRFGALGYELEPKIGLTLLPENEQIYRITTVPLAENSTQGYTVDFRAAMHLVEADEHQSEATTTGLTRVEWGLDLVVTVQFPRFIYRLSRTMVQTAGDRVLHKIVRQVSRRLTYKVQDDFHSTLNLPMPKSAKKPWF
jgi:hypothetical protein